MIAQLITLSPKAAIVTARELNRCVTIAELQKSNRYTGRPAPVRYDCASKDGPDLCVYYKHTAPATLWRG